MALDLVQIRKLAERKENENLRFRRFLKECDVEAGEIDQRVFDITHRVWAGIDCITCANGCRELRPTFSEDEVERVARRLGMERDVFIKTYLDRPDVHEANPWLTRTTPFSFLKSSLCTNGPSVPKSSATSVPDYPLEQRIQMVRGRRNGLCSILRRSEDCSGINDVISRLDLEDSPGNFSCLLVECPLRL